MNDLSKGWVTEFHEGTALSYQYTKKLLDTKSQFQHIEVYETKAAGRILYLDSCLMLTEKEHFVYHEMIVHPALQFSPGTPKTALVIGGGDGGVVSELVKYPYLEQITLCEIDPGVICAAQEFFPEVSKGLNDPRVTVLNQDGAEFAKSSEGMFDLIFVDSTDPVGPAAALYEKEFYQAVKSALTKIGIAVFQTGSPVSMAALFKKNIQDLKSVFNRAYPYLAHISFYPGGLWSFTACCASNQFLPMTLVLGYFRSDDALSELGMPDDLRYYNQDIHHSSFLLPTFVKKLIEEGF
jgi:spermidine synthase